MKRYNNYPAKRVFAAGILLTALFETTGCGSAASSPAPVDKTSQSRTNENGFGVHQRYTPDGKRITTYDQLYDEIDTVYGYCEGGDLVELTESDSYKSASSFSRSPNHPACTDDGLLTPSDFEVQK